MNIVASLQRQRKLLQLAIPMILSNITVPLLGLVDTAVLGHLEEAYYLGGVAVGAMVISLIFWLCGFLRMSTTGLVAQAVGQGDHALARRQISHSLLLALGLGGALIALQWPLAELAFALAGGSAEVERYGRIYFELRIWSAPAALCNMVILGWLLAHQRVRYVVLQLVVVNLTNILLDLWLVVGLEWGVAGAAWASLIADHVGLLVLAVLLPDWRWLRDNHQWRRIEPDLLGGLLRLNRDIFIRSLALQACFATMTFQGAAYGDEIVAANAILLNFLLFMSYALDGFAYAAESLIGQAWGRQRYRGLAALVAQCALWCALVGIGFALGLWGWGEIWIGWLTDLPAIRQQAALYLPWIVLLALVAWGCFLMDGVYIGLVRATTMRNSMLLASLGVFFPVWWLSRDWGNHGLWLAMCLFMLARGLFLGIDFVRVLRRRQ